MYIKTKTMVMGYGFGPVLKRGMGNLMLNVLFVERKYIQKND
jgi:hypothetical protein